MLKHRQEPKPIQSNLKKPQHTHTHHNTHTHTHINTHTLSDPNTYLNYFFKSTIIVIYNRVKDQFFIKLGKMCK